MYCSEKCQQEDHQEFHRFICGHTGLPSDMTCDHVLLKVLLRCLRLFDGSIEDLVQFIMNSPKNKTIFDFDWNALDDKQHLKNLLLTALPKRRTHFMFDLHLEFIHELIEALPDLKEIWIAHGHVLKGLMKQLLPLMPILFSRDFTCGKKLSSTVREPSFIYNPGLYCAATHWPSYSIKSSVGVSADPLYGLLNHSCSPTMEIKFVDNNNVWLMIQPVEAGQQITYGYIGDFSGNPRAARQKSLKFTWRFECDCVACVHDYSILPYLKSINPQFNLMLYILKNNAEVSRSEAKASCEFIKDFINKNFKEHFPSQELVVMTRLMTAQMTFLAKPKFYP